MEAQDCKMNLIAVLFDFKLDPFRGGIRGYEYCNTACGSGRIPQYHITIYPNTETAGTNKK